MNPNLSWSQDLDKRIASRIALMPMLPAVVSELLALRRDDEDYLEQVYRLASLDPTLAVRIVEYAGRTIRVSEGRDRLNLRYAIARLGARSIANLIVSLSLVEAFPVTTRYDRALWVHSLQVAVISRWLTTITERGWAEQAYLAGLLHDIGRFVVFHSIPDVQAMIGDAGYASPQSLVAAEFDVLGTNHVSIGASVCQAWELPDSIARVMALHHHRNLPDDTPEQQQEATRVAIIQIADALSMRLMNRPRLDELDNEQDEQGQRELSEDCIEQVTQMVERGYSRISAHDKSRVIRRLPALLGIVEAETTRLLKGLQLEDSL